MKRNKQNAQTNFKMMLSLMVAASLTSGCATSTVLGRPTARNMDVLNPGTQRGTVLSELGTPTYSKDTTGEKLDTFTFDKGVSGGGKFVRGFFHVAADIFTVCLWEIVAWPAEKIAAKPNTMVEVSYDNDDKVKTVNYIKGHS